MTIMQDVIVGARYYHYGNNANMAYGHTYADDGHGHRPVRAPRRRDVSAHTPAWLMPGLWELAVRVRPPRGPAVSVGLVDHMRA